MRESHGCFWRIGIVPDAWPSVEGPWSTIKAPFRYGGVFLGGTVKARSDRVQIDRREWEGREGVRKRLFERERDRQWGVF